MRGFGLDAGDALAERPDKTAIVFAEADPEADPHLVDGEDTLRMSEARRGA